VYSRGDATRRQWCPLSEINDYVIKGFISAEDRNFYKHKGVNIKRTLYALSNQLFKFKNDFGASTITQQVIKNISGDNEKTLKRKFAELIRAMKIEEGHSKEEILELYLNVIPMSGNLYGISAAAQRYFNKSPLDLTLVEAATLVGMTNSPSRFDPIKHPKECIRKRNNVLFAMLDNNVISKEEYNSAIKEDLIINNNKTNYCNYSSWFIETVDSDVIADLKKMYSINENAARILLESGMKIYTTMNVELQNKLEAMFPENMDLLEEINNGLDGAMVVYNSKTGDLAGIVGSARRKIGDRLLNLADCKRSPGSCIKPISLYAPLLDSKRLNWATSFDDVPQNIETDGEVYKAYPKNSPDVYQGRISLYDAIRLSKNTVASQAYEMLGSNEIIKVLRNKYDIDTIIEGEYRNGKYITDKGVAALALGQLSDGITLRKLTHCYTAFASCGILRGGRCYLRIESAEGGLLYENKNKASIVMKTETAEIMNQLLMGVVERGTAKKITLKDYIDTAGKTGTSGGSLDKTFVGYTPYYTAGIWFGYAEGGKSVNIGQKHLLIWDEIMKSVHESILKDRYNEPERFSTDGLILCEFCMDSGDLPTDACMIDARGNRVQYGYFTIDNQPKDNCSVHLLCYEDENGNLSLSKSKNYNKITSRLLIEREIPESFFIEDNAFLVKQSDFEDKKIKITKKDCGK